MSDEVCVRPEAFDLAAYWAESSAHFIANLPRYPVTVRVAPDAVAYMGAGRYIRMEQAGPPDAEGWIPFHLLFQIQEEACGYVLSFGAKMEVLEPQELREKVIGLAESVVAFYAKSSGTMNLHG
jgi:predicted DNA-binding transcriptional regulator YafY